MKKQRGAAPLETFLFFAILLSLILALILWYQSGDDEVNVETLQTPAETESMDGGDTGNSGDNRNDDNDNNGEDNQNDDSGGSGSDSDN